MIGLYLEDFIDEIKTVPAELKAALAEIGELDATVQNSTAILEERVKTFLLNFLEMKTKEERDEGYKDIRKDFGNVVKIADKKILVADNMTNLVVHYLKKLDAKIFKMKIDLEVNHEGITEELEQRSMKRDAPQENSQEKNRRGSSTSARPSKHYKRKHSKSSSGTADKPMTIKKPVGRPRNSHSSTPVSPPQAILPPVTLSTADDIISDLAGAIDKVAFQANKAGQHNQQGKKSLKASLKANNKGVIARKSSVGKELAGGAEQVQTTSDKVLKSKRQNKRSNSRATSLTKPEPELLPMGVPYTPPASSEDEPRTSQTYGPSVELASIYSERTNDPNEPRYCTCNQVSYGSMVACDNKHCKYQWFHFPCVGILSVSGKKNWYCPTCKASMKPKKNK